jgi:hypothetical protein
MVQVGIPLNPFLVCSGAFGWAVAALAISGAPP